MRERYTGTRPPIDHRVKTQQRPPYSIDRWGVVRRVSKAEEAITRRLAALPNLTEVRA